MKKFLVVLLSLGLIVAFGATASAADVKFGGSYYLVGVYQNNPTLVKDNGYSYALFYTRTRLQPVFTIAEGLTLTIRLDALEKQWGQTDYKGNSTYIGSAGPDDLTATRGNAATKIPKRGIQESVEFERAYVTFMTGIGVFQVGYQNVDDWGTDFGDYSNTRPRIAYSTKLGPMTLNFTYEKVFENESATAAAGVPGANEVAADKDTYALSGIYNAKGVEAGLLYKYYAYDANRPVGVKSAYSQISPYVKATFGPVYVEGEMTYWFGKAAQYELPKGVGAGVLPQDVDMKAWSAYLKGKFNLGPAYFGLLGAYSSGNDLTDDTKVTSAPSGGGTNFAPALILMNDALATWTASKSLAAMPANYTNNPGVTSYNPITSSKYNMMLYNMFAGFNPTPKLNVEAALTYATVDKKAISKNMATGVITEAVSDKLGTEFDVKATYKIYDNLTYMVGAGYLWTGDYFKGSSSSATVSDDYVVLNKLTLSF